MKRTLAILLSLLMVFALFACQKTTEEPAAAAQPTEEAAATDAEQAAAEETAVPAETYPINFATNLAATHTVGGAYQGFVDELNATGRFEATANYSETLGTQADLMASVSGDINNIIAAVGTAALSNYLSVGKLFAAGFIPGVIMALCIGVMIVIECRDKPYLRSKRASVREVFTTLGSSGLSLLTPIVILGGIVSGIVTPTEAAVVAILYSLVLAICYKTMSMRGLLEAINDTVEQTIPILVILAAAQAFGWVLANEQVPRILLSFFSAHIGSRFIALLIINIFLLIIGCFMEAGSALIILVPVLLPIAMQFNVDPVHFGVIMVLNLMIGLITPPVGIILYILKNMTHLTFGQIVKNIMPYLCALLIGLLIVTYCDWLVMLLPRILFG